MWFRKGQGDTSPGELWRESRMNRVHEVVIFQFVKPEVGE